MEFGLDPEGSSSTDPDTKVWQAMEGCYQSCTGLLGGEDKDGRGREEEAGPVGRGPVGLYQHIISREIRVPRLRKGLGMRCSKWWVPCFC